MLWNEDLSLGGCSQWHMQAIDSVGTCRVVWLDIIGVKDIDKFRESEIPEAMVHKYVFTMPDDLHWRYILICHFLLHCLLIQHLQKLETLDDARERCEI